MAENTNISWARHSFNGWIGCTKVSAACKFCYAERDWDKRFHRVQWGPKGPRSLTGKDSWKKPLRWNAIAAVAGEVHTVFAFSLADNMDDHPSILPEWRDRFWSLVAQTPNLEWLLLTKRPENWERFLPDYLTPMPNVRLGVSIEDQEAAWSRGPYLKVMHQQGWRTFVSYGPACGPVEWDYLMGAIDWLVAEGESGPEARPSHPDWFRQARDACAKYGKPFHFKQWGEWAPYDRGRFSTGRTDEPIQRFGVTLSGRLLDGVLHDEFPA